MHLLSINIGTARAVDESRPHDITGIYKEPVFGPVQVTRTGLPADAIISTRHHGGPDQALYVYGGGDYAWWAGELGRELAPGTFGENLTIGDLETAALAIGDRLHIGDRPDTGGVVLEVTAPRIPCDTFARRMGDPAFVARFRAAERPGVYCRVVREGMIQAGDLVRLEPYAGDRVTAAEVFRDYYEPDRSLAAISRFLAVPLAVRAREAKRRQLREALRCEG
jgi:MOSC domain-containing protein YiiM